MPNVPSRSGFGERYSDKAQGYYWHNDETDATQGTANIVENDEGQSYFHNIQETATFVEYGAFDTHWRPQWVDRVNLTAAAMGCIDQKERARSILQIANKSDASTSKDAHEKEKARRTLHISNIPSYVTEGSVWSALDRCAGKVISFKREAEPIISRFCTTYLVVVIFEDKDAIRRVKEGMESIIVYEGDPTEIFLDTPNPCWFARWHSFPQQNPRNLVGRSGPR